MKVPGWQLILGSVGSEFWPEGRDSLAVLPHAAALVLTAFLGVVWLYRVRAARRFKAVVEAYAEREIGRQRRGQGPARTRRSARRASPAPPSA
jgi:hypothetical protein